MDKPKRVISRADILPMDTYARERKTLVRDLVAMKRARRVEVGPYATFYFENYRTMWHQAHEMLRIEKGGLAQIDDELRAYNPMIPQGGDLAATVMFEIDDPVRRGEILARLGGVERAMFLRLGEDIVRARPETEVERTTEDGKTSAVHFVHFDLAPAQAQAFKSGAERIVLGFDHPEYGHMAILADATRKSLAEDLD